MCDVSSSEFVEKMPSICKRKLGFNKIDHTMQANELLLTDWTQVHSTNNHTLIMSAIGLVTLPRVKFSLSTLL